MDMIQTNCALDAATFYALNALKRDVFTSTVEATPLTVGESTVALDTSKISGGDIALMMTATTEKAVRKLRIVLDPGFNIQKTAIVTTGNITNVTTLNAARQIDTERGASKVDSLPTIKLDSLKAMAVAQGHKKTGNWAATNNYPSTSFYRPDGITPNVTWVTGNLTMINELIYGIFIVEGSCTMNGTGQIIGVLYLPNVMSTVINKATTGSNSSVKGGIVSRGDVSGKSGVSGITIEQNPTYMTEFSKFLKFGVVMQNKLISWVYL
jgi:hypothetical protein